MPQPQQKYALRICRIHYLGVFIQGVDATLQDLPTVMKIETMVIAFAKPAGMVPSANVTEEGQITQICSGTEKIVTKHLMY